MIHSNRILALVGFAAATAACGGPAARTVAQGTESPTPATGVTVARPACATPDDETGTMMSGTFASPPEPLYAAGAAVLRGLGFAVLENSPPRELITAPSHAWPAGTESEAWHGPEHPGLEMFLVTRSAGDSTVVTIGARALCLVPGTNDPSRSPEVGRNLEMLRTLEAMNALLTRLQRQPGSGAASR